MSFFIFYAFGFSQLSTKYETTKPPAMRVVSNKVIQNNHHSFYNEGVQAIKIRKNVLITKLIAIRVFELNCTHN